MKVISSVLFYYERLKEDLRSFGFRFFYIALLCVFVLTLFVPATTFAMEAKSAIVIPNQTVRGGLFPQAGSHSYQDGKPLSGYGYDYLQYLRRYAPWQYQYSEQILDWSGTMQLLLDGKIDLMTYVRKTTEREELLAFSKLAMGETSTILTVKCGDTHYRAGDYIHWNSIRIGIPRSSTMRKIMAEFAIQHGFTYTEVPYDGIPEMLQDLQAGLKLDAAVSNNLRVLRNEFVLAQLFILPFEKTTRNCWPNSMTQWRNWNWTIRHYAAS